jgi:hypothetical protein
MSSLPDDGRRHQVPVVDRSQPGGIVRAESIPAPGSNGPMPADDPGPAAPDRLIAASPDEPDHAATADGDGRGDLLAALTPLIDPFLGEAGIVLMPPGSRIDLHNAWLVAHWAFENQFLVTLIERGNKRPMYRAWGLNRPTRRSIDNFFYRHADGGCGVCLGPGQGPLGTWIIDIEGDGPEAEESFRKLFGDDIIATFGWRSPRGIHLIFVVWDGAALIELLKAAGATVVKGEGRGPGVFKLDDYPALEWRIGGYKSDGIVKQFHSVIPPLNGRVFNDCWTIAWFPDAATAALQGLAERRAIRVGSPSGRGGRKPAAGAGSRGRRGPGRAYALGALRDECEIVATTPPGPVCGPGRNNQLNDSAFRIGTLIGGGGQLDRSEAERALEDAARRCGLDQDPGCGPAGIAATIESGLTSGLASPRDLSSVGAGHPPSGDGHAGGGVRGDVTADVGLYFECDNKIWVVGEYGPEWLTDFKARIVAEVRRHEAGLEAIHYEIEATHESEAVGTRRVAIPGEKYPGLSWVYALGPQFTIKAGRDMKDHVRCAVQMISTKAGITSTVQHTSLGWVRHGDQWLYVHAGGAIGADGPSAAVRVDPPTILSRYRLPEPPTDPEAIRAAIVATLAIWDLSKAATPGARGAAAMVATEPWRAVLSPFDVSCHFGGPSGNLKTSTARLVLQHFALDVRGRNAPTPAGWNDTKNALQRLAYDCACSVLVIDDLKTNAQLETAEAIFQAQGNLQNRARMAVDQSLQQPLDPRGSILSTGEIDPRTASTLGRMLMAEIKRGDIDRGVLARLQHSGDAGSFATAMSAYIRWLAPRLDEIRGRHAKLTAEIREDLGEIPGAHPRHPDAVAQLLAAYRLFLSFLVETGSITRPAAEGLAKKAKKYLVELARLQAYPQQEAKAGRTFLDLIAAALRSKRCHLAVADSDEAPQQYAGASGWHKDWLYQGKHGQMLDWKIPTNSKLIGFIDEDAGLVYLDPTESAAVASEQGRRHDTPQSFSSIGRELLNEGLCRSHLDGEKTRATGDKRIHNHGKRRYFWIAIPDLFGDSKDAPNT